MGVLKAKVGGSWVPITQGYSSAQVGFVAQQVLTSATGTTGTHTTYQDTGMSLTINEVAGRVLKVSLIVNPYGQGGSNAVWYQLLRNGVNVREWTIPAAAIDNITSHSITLTHVIPSAAGGSGVVYKTRIKGGSNTAVQDYADSSLFRALLIEDITQVQPADTSLVGAWIPMTLLNSWVNFGSGYQDAQYRKIGDIVYLRGWIKSGVAGTTIFQLPGGYRPPTYVHAVIEANDKFGILRVDAAGVVILHIGDPLNHILLNCNFSVAT